MPCESIRQELNALISENNQLQAEYQRLAGSAKSQSPLRGQILALDKKIETKNAELTACLIANGVIDSPVRTKFRPETDGFLFANHWTWDATEKQILTKVITDLLDGLEAVLSPILYAALAPAFLAIPPPFDILAIYEAVKAANKKIVETITKAVETADGGVYGLCGGMAFSSLDYWHERWVVPQGTGTNDQPQRTTPQGTVLRNYIWDRLLKSVEDNGLKVLQWMGMFGGGGGPGGGKWLLEHTVTEIASLRRTITSGRPVTIALIGTTSSPFNNHQVLCYGFKDEPDGTLSLFIYDNNHPGVESVIRLDLRGSILNAVHDDTFQADRGPLRGLFCTVYVPSRLSAPVVLREGLAVTPSSTGLKMPVDVQYTAANIGYHTSTPMNLVVSSDSGEFAGEAEPASIAQGGQRQIKTQLTYDKSGSHKIGGFADLGRPAGISIVKVLPPETSKQSDVVTVTIV
jgi:hypothetical protein